MKKLKYYLFLILFLFLSVCGTVKEAFSNQKKNSSDEFLVEKKSPLVMPPDFDELPIPKIKKKILIKMKEKNNIKKLIIKKKNNVKMIMKKIKKIILKKLY